MRLHHQIAAPFSTLELKKTQSGIELVEHFWNMRSIIHEISKRDQGELVNHFRLIESEKGTFNYNTSTFLAPKVILTHLETPNERVDETLFLKEGYLKGSAQKVSLVFSKGSPHFQAESFKATLGRHEEELE